jgi:hypothetical protein
MTSDLIAQQLARHLFEGPVTVTLNSIDELSSIPHGSRFVARQAVLIMLASACAGRALKMEDEIRGVIGTDPAVLADFEEKFWMQIRKATEALRR